MKSVFPLPHEPYKCSLSGLAKKPCKQSIAMVFGLLLEFILQVRDHENSDKDGWVGECIFIKRMPWGCLRFVIVVFPDQTHLLFFWSVLLILMVNYGEFLLQTLSNFDGRLW